MQTNKCLLLFTSLLFILSAATAQYPVFFKLSQPALLQAHPGNNAIVTIMTNITLGDLPAATGGTPPYTYTWSPGAMLSDSTIANPSVTILHDQIFTLSIIDSKHCSTSAEVDIKVDTGIESDATVEETFSVFPNPLTSKEFTIINLQNTSHGYFIIRNMKGQEVYRENLKNERIQSFQLPAYPEIKGVLLLEIHAQGVHALKMIVL